MSILLHLESTLETFHIFHPPFPRTYISPLQCLLSFPLIYYKISYLFFQSIPFSNLLYLFQYRHCLSHPILQLSFLANLDIYNPLLLLYSFLFTSTPCSFCPTPPCPLLNLIILLLPTFNSNFFFSRNYCSTFIIIFIPFSSFTTITISSAYPNICSFSLSILAPLYPSSSKLSFRSTIVMLNKI